MYNAEHSIRNGCYRRDESSRLVLCGSEKVSHLASQTYYILTGFPVLVCWTKIVLAWQTARSGLEKSRLTGDWG